MNTTFNYCSKKKACSFVNYSLNLFFGCSNIIYDLSDLPNILLRKTKLVALLKMFSLWLCLARDAFSSWCRGLICLFLFVLFDLILNVPSIIFQLNRDGSSWVGPVLS